ncbi:MAG TPA: Hsp20 family protein [Caulobacteraceae bacterium]|jgi:HSP20 family molecular chaperone IbpA|nr:Hsp20 family protein [Caulobacteraceae bacterium]
MNRAIVFDSPFLLGFDHTRSLIERVSKAAGEGYPPYNVEESSDGRVRITVAVAGFLPDQLAVTVEDNHLTIAGKRESEGEAERAFLHRGIAARSFVRGFILADGMEVEGATLEHGLLHVDAFRPQTASVKRQVPIKAAG